MSLLKRVAMSWLALALATACATEAAERPVERVILFGIDGLAAAAPERIGMPTFLALVSEGTWIKKAFVAPPWHPTTGPWGNLHSTSYPNVVQLAGTLFITPDTQFIQEAWLPRRPTRGAPAGITAHATNSTAYASLNRGFHHTYMQRGPDKDVVDWAVDLLRRTDVRFMRIHLQNSGEAGRVGSGDETKDVPWRHNIWADGSPYRIAALEADRQLARFVAALKAIGKWEGTVLLVTSDHGQADQGWHAPLSEGAWSTPMLWIGPHIATGRILDYGEHTDVAPTIAFLLGVPQPNPGPGAGRVMTEVLNEGEPVSSPRRIETLDRQMRDYLLLEAEMRTESARTPSLDNTLMQLRHASLTERQFYGLDRFLEWHEAGSIDALIENNASVLDTMRDRLREIRQKGRD